MRSPALAAVLGLLCVALFAYFALILRRADALASVLLLRGYAERGWTRERLAGRLRLLGIGGCAVSLAGVALVIVRFL